MSTYQNSKPAHQDMLHPNLAVEINLSSGLNFIIAGLKGLGCSTLVMNIDRDIMSLEFTEEAIENFRSYAYSTSVYLKYTGTMLCVAPNSRFYNIQQANLQYLSKLSSYFMANGVIIDIGPKIEKNILANSQICAKFLATSIEGRDLNLPKVFLRENEESKIGEGVLNQLDNTNYKLCHYSNEGSKVPINGENKGLNVGIAETKKIVSIPDNLKSYIDNNILCFCSTVLHDTLESIERLRSHGIID